MRTPVLMLLGIGTILGAAPARAQTYDPSYPVCMNNCKWGGCQIECSYTSLAQCNASASGRGALCYTNPFFATGSRQPPRRSYRRF